MTWQVALKVPQNAMTTGRSLTSNPSSENIENARSQLADWTVISIAQLCVESRALTTSWLKEKIKAAKGGC